MKQKIHITDEEMIDKICVFYEEKAGINRNSIVFKRRGAPDNTWKSLFEALFTTEDKSAAAEKLKYTVGGLESALARQKVNGVVINEILHKKSLKSWRNWFPETLFNIKYCIKCRCYYSVDYFSEMKRGQRAQRETEYRTSCTDCYSEQQGLSVKNYKKNNPEKIAAIGAHRRACLNGEIKNTPEHEEIYKLSQQLTKELGVPFNVDHIIPLAEGGTHAIENLQIITAKENRAKWALSKEEWEASSKYKTFLKDGHIWRVDIKTQKATQLVA